MISFAGATKKAPGRPVSVKCTVPPHRRFVKCKTMTPTKEAFSGEQPGVEMMSLPAVRGLPIIGMTKYLVDNEMDLSELHKEHGKAFVIDFGAVMGGWNLAVCSEKAAKDVLTANEKIFVSSWPEEFTRLFSPWGDSTAEPAEQNAWKQSMVRIMSKDNVMSFQLPLMVPDITKRLRGYASSGEQVRWTDESRRIAFGVASRTSMGSLLSDEDVDEYFKTFNHISASGMMSFGLRDGLPGTAFHKSMKARRKIEGMLYPKIKAVLDDEAVLEGETSGVARLVRAMHEDAGDYIPQDTEALAWYIARQTYFFMIAGTDTTSVAIQRLAVLLNRHPEWLAKLQQEQDRLRAEFGDTLDRKVLSRSAVAMAVAQEALRIKIPVRSAFRTAARDTTVEGVRVPKGTRIVVNLALPTLGTGTDSFDPAQWLNADETQAAPNSGSGNLVWSTGPRRCAGSNLATLEVITCLAIIGREVERFDIPPEKNDHDYLPGPNHPTGVPTTLVPRPPRAAAP